MSVTLEFNFDQIVGLAKQLSPEEQTRLVRELSESGGNTSSEWPSDSEHPGFIRMVVSTGNPIFTPEDFERFRQNAERRRAATDWEQVKKNHQELLKSSLEWPVATEEEIEMQNAIRESMEQWII